MPRTLATLPQQLEQTHRLLRAQHRLLREQAGQIAAMQTRLGRLEQEAANTVEARRDEAAANDPTAGDESAALAELLQAIAAYWGSESWSSAEVVAEVIEARSGTDAARLRVAMRRAGIQVDVKFETKARQALGSYLRRRLGERKSVSVAGHTLHALGKDRRNAARWRITAGSERARTTE